MIKGFNDCASEAGTSVTGGQTVYNPYPLIGGTAISVPKREKIVMPNFAKSGDLLVLTKPVGT
jgi:selenide,water dikinase